MSEKRCEYCRQTWSDFTSWFNHNCRRANPASPERTCSVELTCDGGIFNCQKADLEKENAELRAELDETIAQLKGTPRVHQHFITMTTAAYDRVVMERDEWKQQAEKLKLALEFVVEREDFSFVECKIAEELWSRCKQALAEYAAWQERK